MDYLSLHEARCAGKQKRAVSEREETLKWCRWRWEFMRHNRKVKAAYGAALRLRKRAKYPPGTVRQDGNFIEDLYASTPEYNVEMNLKRALGVPFVFCLFPNPEKTFEELKYQPESGIVFHEIRKAVIFNESQREMNKLEIKIDFNWVNSLRDIKHLVDSEITAWFEASQRGRKNSTDYDLILKIGELKQQGLTGGEIANRLGIVECLNGDEKNPERKINKLHKEFKKLVNGGYYRLSFP